MEGSRLLSDSDVANLLDPIPGVRRYRGLNEKQLRREVVRRGIVPSLDAIQLDRLHTRWRPTVFRTLLAVHDRLPHGALRFDGGIITFNEDFEALARYERGHRILEINTGMYSATEAAFLPRRGFEHPLLNHIAGTVAHECWHCVQDPYTPEFRNWIADRWQAALGDLRARFPLAAEEFRTAIKRETRGYALTSRIELEAELARRYFQGSRNLFAVEMLSAVDSFTRVHEVFSADISRAQIPNVLDRLLRKHRHRDASMEVERETLSSPQPSVPSNVATDLSGSRKTHDVESLAHVGATHPAMRPVSPRLVREVVISRDEQSIRAHAPNGAGLWAYIQTESGDVMRIDGTTLIHVTRSYDSGELVTCDIPKSWALDFRGTVGEPLWFAERFEEHAALDERFSGSPVAKIVCVPRGVGEWEHYGSGPGFSLSSNAFRSDPLVCNAEIMLAAVNRVGHATSAKGAGLERACLERDYRPSHVRCTRPQDGIVGVEQLRNLPYCSAAVLRDAQGNELWIERTQSLLTYPLGDPYNPRRTVLRSPSIPLLREGAIFEVEVASAGGRLTFGPVVRIDLIEQLPFTFDAIAPIHGLANVSVQGRAEEVAPGRRVLPDPVGY